MADGSKMIMKEKDGKVERFEKHMPKNYWQRNKKQSVDYLHDSPFATERQLEDQRFLMQQNRNPQLLVPTKVDKIRSVTITGSVSEPRAIAVKAHVLNKVVREASGMHAYTIVAPPKAVTGEDKVEKIEPETNPRVRPYLKEAKMKPVLCSFGHRPRSASRTFHPATMRFRLRHGQIANSDDPNKTGFGLPVTVLAKVLRAPKLHHPNELMEDSESLVDSPTEHGFSSIDRRSRNSAAANAEADMNDLFFSAAEQAEIFGGGKKHAKFPDDASGSKTSWVSSTEGSKNVRRRKKLQAKLSPIEDDRPAWDEGHHRVHGSRQSLLELRKSGLADGDKLSLHDRMHRFSKLTVAETQLVPFCTEKQLTDKKIMAGIEHKVPKSEPIKNQPLYFDPLDERVQEVNYYYKIEQEKKQKLKEERARLAKWRELPRQKYFPTTRLAALKAQTSASESKVLLSSSSAIGSEFSDDLAAAEPSPSTTTLGARAGTKHNNNSSSIGNLNGKLRSPHKQRKDSSTLVSSSHLLNADASTVLDEVSGWEDMEDNWKQAMAAMRSGDEMALYKYYFDKQTAPAATADVDGVSSTGQEEMSQLLDDDIAYPDEAVVAAAFRDAEAAAFEAAMMEAAEENADIDDAIDYAAAVDAYANDGDDDKSLAAYYMQNEEDKEVFHQEKQQHPQRQQQWQMSEGDEPLFMLES